ncbi:MAG: prephenate dehydrogenase/arogenate dehydrogenase family protein [Alphaproteobacteria bacterium]|nr:prephenate dehydrogenase/arogenate dehydrogenase family protein [Alphaproteobacteria bacterium]MBV8549452.1 prephenate dehydrogenase/arogenate dehydrogenase family protein [Alphaproteobacteria bacterium]
MKIGIIGIGQIGSSLARAFKKYEEHLPSVPSLLICDNNREHLAMAEEIGLGDSYHTDLTEVAAAADLIFLCTPVNSIGPIAAAMAPHLKHGAIITDVGSTKLQVLNDVKPHLPAHAHFVPGHPIAGAEFHGPLAGKPDMFADKTYILCDDAQAPSNAAQTVSALLAAIGANITLMPAALHDSMLAFTSHMPHLCAFATTNTAGKISQELGLNVWKFAGGSLQDMTRVAASSVAMWRDVFLSNRAPLVAMYKQFRDEMDHLANIIDSGDAATIESYLTNARAQRLKSFGS